MVCLAIVSSALMVSAGTPVASTTGALKTDTYIVVFNDARGMASVLDEQIATFAADNDATVLQQYDLINGIAIRVPGADAAAKLGALENVKYVEPNIEFHATLEQAGNIVGAPQVPGISATPAKASKSLWSTLALTALTRT